MANHPQAEKRNRQRNKRQTHHRHYRATMRTYIKRVLGAVLEKNNEAAVAALKVAIPMIDRCGQRAIIPRKRANRLVSRLTKHVDALQ